MTRQSAPPEGKRAPAESLSLNSTTPSISGPGSGLSLRDYQREALAAIHDRASKGITRQLVVLPTGSGKTVCFAHLIAQAVATEQRALVLVHRDELLTQAAEKIQLVAPGIDLGIVKAERREVDRSVVVASIQSLRPARLAELGSFGLVIVDEAHHSAAASYKRILTALSCFEDGGPLTLGFTATPDRGDGRGLNAIYQEIVYSKGLVEMISAGFLSDLRGKRIELEADFNTLNVTAGDFDDADSARMLMAADAPGVVARAYQEHAAGRKGLVFTPTIAVAEETAAALTTRGIPAEALSGQTPIADRRAALKRFRKGTTTVICNAALLIEGFDESSVDCVVVARPTRSRPLYVQMVGRATRLHPGKQDGLILDLVGATEQHDLCTLAGLAGVEPREVKEKGVAEVLAEAKRHDAPEGTWAADLVAREIELFTRREMHWVHSGDGRYSISTGTGVVVLNPTDDGGWNVEHRTPAGPRVVARNLSLGYAQGTGEDIVRKEGGIWLARSDAAWRSRPASGKQRACLKALGIKPTRAMTSGEASDLISAAKLRRAS